MIYEPTALISEAKTSNKEQKNGSVRIYLTSFYLAPGTPSQPHHHLVWYNKKGKRVMAYKC